MSNTVSHFSGLSYKEGSLYCEGLSATQLARHFGTPLYVYSRQALLSAAHDWLDGIKGTSHRVFFAVKSNSNIGLLNLFAQLGLGFDIVSGGELERVIAAGADPSKVVYSGVGKTREEMQAALKANIACFNLENPQELDRLQEEAAKLNKIAAISFRVNPDVDAKTHPYISTGLKDNKFGVSVKEATHLYRRALTMPNIRVSGIDCHVGSQITEIAPFIEACDVMLDIVDNLKKQGVVLDHIDFGGGLGVRYNKETPPKAQELIRVLSQRCAERGYQDTSLYFEPGRSLTAEAGLLLTRVEYLKDTPDKHYCVVDAAMNDMLRPALYQADMPMVNTETHPDIIQREYDIVGPICESSDWLSKNQSLAIQEGDILAMTCAGAYGMTMSSNYNTRTKAAEVLVDNDKAFVIRRRETLNDILRLESLPIN